jgi:hypothetical protein
MLVNRLQHLLPQSGTAKSVVESPFDLQASRPSRGCADRLKIYQMEGERLDTSFSAVTGRLRHAAYPCGLAFRAS